MSFILEIQLFIVENISQSSHVHGVDCNGSVKIDRIKYIYDPTLNGFDFYDIDFCLNNFVHKSCKIGVTTNIRMAHNSIGELKESWDVNRKIINKKYKKYYPIDIDKDGKKETR